MQLRDLTAKILGRRADSRSPLRIVQSGHPALRMASRDWDGQLEPELLDELVAAMVITMHEAPGVGVAAPQVGIPLRLAVLQDGDPDAQEDATGDASEHDAEEDPLERTPLPLRVFLNPVYTPIGEEQVLFWEGCLSIDGWMSIVPRSRQVRLDALEWSPGGGLQEVHEEFTGWPARIVQHETDHLAGTLCHDLGVPRSFIETGYTDHYADLTEAVRVLGLDGDVTRLGPGQVRLRRD